MPPLLGAALPRFAGLEGGALGELLASYEVWVLGNWGALLINAVAAALGALAVTHISLERAIGGVGLAMAALIALALGAVTGAGRAAIAAGRSSRRAFAAAGRGLEEGWRSLTVWRERRARRVRVAAQREPEPVVEAELGEAAPPSLEPAPARMRARVRRRSSITPRSARRAAPARRASRSASIGRTDRIGFPTSRCSRIRRAAPAPTTATA